MALDLTLRQTRFVDAIRAGKGVEEAAVEAGFSPKTAAAQGYRLMRHNRNVRAALADLRPGAGPTLRDCLVQLVECLANMTESDTPGPDNVSVGFTLNVTGLELPPRIHRSIAHLRGAHTVSINPGA